MTHRSTWWLKITIVVAVALLASYLLLSLAIGNTYQQQATRALADTPVDSHEIGSRHTACPLQSMRLIVATMCALSLCVLMLMYILLTAKHVYIKHCLGASRQRLLWEGFVANARLVFCGVLLYIIIVLPLLTVVGRFLDINLQLSSRIWLAASAGIAVLALPSCTTAPAVANRILQSAAQQGLHRGLGKKHLGLLQTIVSIAIASAVAAVFLVTLAGRAALTEIDAKLRGVGHDMVVLEEPALGTFSPQPTLTLTDYVNLCGP